MQPIHCPLCHSEITLEAIVQDDAARELFALVFHPETPRVLVGYLALFQTGKRKLPWERSLRLAQEVMVLDADLRRLAIALSDTVEAIRAKREAGENVKPMKNHNYLRKVLESVPSVVAAPAASAVPAVGRGRRAQGMQALAAWGEGCPLRTAVAHGLQALLALSLDGAPGADTVAATADVWLHVLAKNGVTIPDIDAQRVEKAFSSLMERPLPRWPEPAQLVQRLPRRSDRAKLTAPHSVNAEADRAAIQALYAELDERS